MTDEQLMREAMAALKLGEKLVRTELPDKEPFCPSKECPQCRFVRKAHTAIDKLEERLLKE